MHGLAGIAREMQPDAAVDHHIGIVGIDADLTEVHRPRILVVHFAPGRAGVVGTVQPGGGVGVHAGHQVAAPGALLRLGFLGRAPFAPTRPAFASSRAAFAAAPSAGRRRPFDQCIRTVGPAGALQTRPVFTAVNRFPQAAPRTAAVHAACRAPALIRRCVEDLAVGGVHHQIVRAGVVVDLENLFPAPATIRRLVNAAFTAGAEQIAGCRDEHDVGVARIDDDPVDVLRCFQAHAGERLPAVRRFVDAVAPRRALTVVRFAAPEPDEIGIAL